MKVRYDKGSDAVYIEFEIENGQLLEQDHVDGEWPINVDISKSGEVMGIEILDASHVLSAKFLDSADK